MAYIKRWYVKNSYNNYNHFIMSDCEDLSVVIDPYDAEDVLRRMYEYKVRLVGILLTHEHMDHYRGAKLLSDQTKAPIYAHYSNINNLPKMDVKLYGDDVISFGKDIHLQVIETPGHIKGHVCFYSKVDAFLICGDTVFNAGVGNVKALSSNISDLFYSIDKILQLPSDTKVYPAHDYFEHNLSFMKSLDMKNELVKCFFKKVSKETPNTRYISTLENELKYNYFLMVRDNHVVDILRNISGQRDLCSGLQAFKVLRKLRDNW
jgi:hydroxyacylglutathione hydrolase